MTKANHIFSLLEPVAELSDHPRYKMAAAIVQKNRVISFGYNRMKTDPLQARFAKNQDCIYLHAEIACIKNALRKLDVDNLRKTDLYVMRVRNNDDGTEWAMSKPCEGCMRAIEEFGIRRVFYTTNPGEFATLA